MLIVPPNAGRLSYGQTELIHTIRRCGLTSGLQLCLDAGDALSYSSGQSWLDRSGNGYDFFRGADGSAAADDPTFNGTAGNRSPSEYWSFDGGDYFTYDSANETWMKNLHKDNAKFTLAAWTHGPSLTAINQIWAVWGVTELLAGLNFQLTSSAKLRLAVAGGGPAALDVTSTLTVPRSSWQFLAVSLDESVGANGGMFYNNGISETFTSTYSSPTALDPSLSYCIAAIPEGYAMMENTSRLGMFAAWEGVALTQTQLNALYQTTRGRFGV